jgi:hypothetical protein
MGKVLLRQPGGFEGFGVSRVLVAVDDLAVAHLPVRIDMRPNVDAAPPTSAPFAEGRAHVLALPFSSSISYP